MKFLQIQVVLKKRNSVRAFLCNEMFQISHEGVLCSGKRGILSGEYAQ